MTLYNTYMLELEMEWSRKQHECSQFVEQFSSSKILADESVVFYLLLTVVKDSFDWWRWNYYVAFSFFSFCYLNSIHSWRRERAQKRHRRRKKTLWYNPVRRTFYFSRILYNCLSFFYCAYYICQRQKCFILMKVNKTWVIFNI